MALGKFQVNKFLTGMDPHLGGAMPAHFGITILMYNLPDLVKLQLNIGRLWEKFHANTTLGGQR